MSSMSEARNEIAAALVAAGIDGTAYPPRTLARGQGWPEWSYSEPASYLGDSVTWLVHVILPAGTPESVAATADEILDDLLSELERVSSVTRYEPSTFIPEAGGDQTLPAITFTVTTV